MISAWASDPAPRGIGTGWRSDAPGPLLADECLVDAKTVPSRIGRIHLDLRSIDRASSRDEVRANFGLPALLEASVECERHTGMRWGSRCGLRRDLNDPSYALVGGSSSLTQAHV